jgi:hypothetical protein
MMQVVSQNPDHPIPNALKLEQSDPLLIRVRAWRSNHAEWFKMGFGGAIAMFDSENNSSCTSLNL